MTTERMYFHAFHCGHREWFNTYPQFSIAWCHLCGKFVGVAISIKPIPPPTTVPPTKESDGNQ